MNVHLATRLRHLRFSGMVDALPSCAGPSTSCRTLPTGQPSAAKDLLEVFVRRRAQRLLLSGWRHDDRTPLSAPRLRQVDERALVDLESFELLEQLRA